MTEAERARFRSRHPIGTMARAAFEILYYTAIRREDARLLGPKNIIDDQIVMVQSKTGGEPLVQGVQPQMMDAIAAVHAAMRVVNIAPDIFILTEKGKSYSSRNTSGKTFKRWCAQAGLPHCSAHSVRKGTLTMLAERSRTVHEIAAYGGHKSLRMVETYTRKARRAELARAAAEAFQETKVSTTLRPVFKKEKKA